MLRRRWRTCLFAIAGLLLIIVLLSVVGVGIVSTPYGQVYIGGLRSIPFDGEVWKAADGYVGDQLGSRGPAWDSRRARMRGDLLRSHLHRGMSPTEVRRLLGKPSYVYESSGGQSRVDTYELFAFPNSAQKWIAKEVWGEPFASATDGVSRRPAQVYGHRSPVILLPSCSSQNTEGTGGNADSIRSRSFPSLISRVFRVYVVSMFLCSDTNRIWR